MKEYTIIGCNSYLGSNLIYYLYEKGYVKLNLYDVANSLEKTSYEFDIIDFQDMKTVKNIKMDVDAIFYFVGLIGTNNSIHHYDEYVKVNEIYLLNILNELKERKLKTRFIYPSTGLVYKSSDMLLDEEAEFDLKSIYAINKMSAENYIKLFNRVAGVQFCILRIGIPYGSIKNGKNGKGLFGVFLGKIKDGENIQIYGDGNDARTFIYIEDLCYIFDQLGTYKEHIDDIFNVGGWNGSIYQFAKKITNVYGGEISFVKWPESEQDTQVRKVFLNSRKLDGLIRMKYNYKLFEGEYVVVK